MTRPRLTNETIAAEVLREVMPAQHQVAFRLIAELYDDDAEAVINGLMDMTVRAAILGGVTAEMFSAGMKHHWDTYADAINRGQS
jgi:hypothetical protein